MEKKTERSKNQQGIIWLVTSHKVNLHMMQEHQLCSQVQQAKKRGKNTEEKPLAKNNNQNYPNR